MRKSARKKIIIIFFGIISFVLLYKSLNKPAPVKPKEPAVVKSTEKKNKTSSLVLVRVASMDLNAGDVISNSSLRWQKFEESELPEGAITIKMREFDVLGKVLNTSLKKGVILLVSDLSSAMQGFDKISPGMALHAFKINASKGIGLMIQPNTFVRVLYTEANKTVVLIDYARVISVVNHSRTVLAGNRNNESEVKLNDDAFVEVTPQMAQMLSIDHGGIYTLVPIKYHPKSIVPISPYRAGDISKIYLHKHRNSRNNIIRSIKGDKVTFHELHAEDIDRHDLEQKPIVSEETGVEIIEPGKNEDDVVRNKVERKLRTPKTKDKSVPKPLLKPPYRFMDEDK